MSDGFSDVITIRLDPEDLERMKREMEEALEGRTVFAPVREIVCDKDALRCIMHVDPEIGDNFCASVEHCQRAYEKWLTDPAQPLILFGISRVEFVVLPKPDGEVVERV